WIDRGKGHGGFRCERATGYGNARRGTLWCRPRTTEQAMQPGHPVALVTGAARRLGAAIARRLHAAGYDLALHYRGSEREALALAAKLESSRAGSVLALQAELSEFDRLPELVARTVGRFGRLDALVNNASGFAPATFGDIHPGHWDRMMAVNARAP